MYYTTYEPTNSVWRAGMDSSNAGSVLTGLEGLDIQIDFKTSRLVWSRANKIHSTHSNGIGLANGRIYWGEWSGKTLRSSTSTGDDISTLHTEESLHTWLWSLAMVFLETGQTTAQGIAVRIFVSLRSIRLDVFLKQRLIHANGVISAFLLTTG